MEETGKFPVFSFLKKLDVWRLTPRLYSFFQEKTGNQYIPWKIFPMGKNGSQGYFTKFSC